ncbi:MAG: hypothetical protein QOJ23_2574 [Actinomycetota bacterium]|nr:hypothetical protein [Actinomycetota bacterium]MDQ1567320.1 hypothetical protein [Actinomycetota bacterium]
MGRPRWAAAAVLATITLAACTGGTRPKTSANGQVAETSSTTSGVKGARTIEELSQALDINVPSGYTRQPDSVDDTGPSDLDKAVADDGEDDARDVFTRDRFVRGYQREWARSENDQIVSYVYQFADNAGAVDYTKRVTADAGAQTAGVSITTFTVPGIAGAIGVNGSDPSFATATVTFVKGPYSAQVVVNGTSAAGLQSLVTSLAEEQYSRL